MFENFKKSRLFKALFPSGSAPPMITTGLMVVVSVSFVAYMMLTERFNPDEPVALTISVTQAAPAAPSAPIVLRIDARITNNSDNLVTLTAPTPCDIFRWSILSPASELVQTRPEQVCVQLLMTAELAGEHHHDENFTIELDPTRVHAGGDYQLMVNYWGYEARTPLSIE